VRFKRTMASLVIAAAAVTSVALAAPAQAQNSWNLNLSTSDANPGGQLFFGKVGDVVQACDTQADGKSAEAYVYKGSTLVYKFNASTSGTCVTKNAAMEGVYDLVEGASYTFKICLEDSAYSPAKIEFCNSATTTA